MSQSIALNRYFITAILMVFTLFARGQNSVDRMLRIDERTYNVTFSMPEGYVECDSGFTFLCRDSKLSSAIVYSIIKLDSSVKIGLSFVPVTDSVTSANLKIHYPTVNFSDPNMDYLISARNRTDTTRFPIEHYDTGYTKKRFNADHALSITRDCKVPYYIWDHNRTVFIAKDNVCRIELTYLYTEKASKDITEEIKRTEGMIWFK